MDVSYNSKHRYKQSSNKITKLFEIQNKSNKNGYYNDSYASKKLYKYNDDEWRIKLNN